MATPPKHVLIREGLRELATLRLPEHTRLPSERSLAANFGTSRMTVRQAIEALVLEGVLYRRTRVGTFTAPQAFATSPTTARGEEMGAVDDPCGTADVLELLPEPRSRPHDLA